MSKVFKAVATVAAVVALAATGIGAVMGAAAFAATFGASAATIAAVASTVSAVAGVLAQATMKPPDMKGSVSQVAIGRNMPVPYMLGRTYTGGIQVYDDSSGSKNKYRFQGMVLSAGGPIEEFEQFLGDYSEINFDDWGDGTGNATGWFDTWMKMQIRYGARPDTAFNYTDDPPIPGWTSAHKLSGYAAYMVRLKFDKDGKRFASGIPQMGWVAKGVKVYDPRLDSTYPGGLGSHIWDDESTWEWSENPALHALAYARGRYMNDVRVVGCGFPKESIDFAPFVELANICDANGWTVGGMIYEGPGGSKWENLKRILQAAAASPVWTGGQLTLKYSAPKIPVVTITPDSLADGDVSVQAMKSWRDKVNTVVARVRLESQRWEYTQIDEVTDETYLAEDGEAKTKEIQFDLVQDKDQGAELAAYELVNSREFGPVTLPLKPAFLPFRPGEAVQVDLPELGLENQLCIITGRQVAPESGAVMMTLESETTAKHDFALGRTSTAPPTPTIHPPQESDEAVADPGTSTVSQLIATSYPVGLSISIEEDGTLIISDHIRRYTDIGDVAVTGATIETGLAAGTFRGIAYDDADRAGGAVTYQLFADDLDARVSATNPGRHYVGYFRVPAAGAGTGEGGGSTPPGGTCVTPNTLILMADGSEKPAGDIVVGDVIRTRHEDTLEWGDHAVTWASRATDKPLFAVLIDGKRLEATAEHRIHVNGEWVKMREAGLPANKRGDVIKLTVDQAHTYISNGILSHNLKPEEGI